MYAGDTVLMAESREGIQQIVNEFEISYDRIIFKINVDENNVGGKEETQNDWCEGAGR